MDKSPATFSVYLVRCADGSLYCGIAVDVEARVAQHNTGKLGARYTKSRRPVALVYQTVCGSRSDALKEERRIKKLLRAEKEMLVKASSGTVSKKSD